MILCYIGSFSPLNDHFSFSNIEKAECVFLLITIYTVQKLNADVLCNSNGILVLLKILANHAYLLNSFFWSVDLQVLTKKVGVLPYFID